MFQKAEITAEDPGEDPGEGTTGLIPNVQVWITGRSVQGMNVVLLAGSSSLGYGQAWRFPSLEAHLPPVYRHEILTWNSAVCEPNLAIFVIHPNLNLRFFNIGGLN